MFHAFGPVRTLPFVVRSVELTYEERPTVSTLSSAQTKGWRWTGTAYDQATLPAVSLSYAQPTIDPSIRLVGGIGGFSPRQWRFADLDGEGLTGLLTEQGQSWWYKRNEGDGTFGLARQLSTRPNAALGAPGTRLVDVDGDGTLDLVLLRPGVAGFYARDDGGWKDFRSFRRVPNVDPDDPRVRWIDLNGDGHADLMKTDGEAYTWWPSEGRDGFDAPIQVRMPNDADKGPRLAFARDGEQIFVADMTGDGLPDLVRVMNGNICYWPNRGHGRFGSRVQMKGAPRFDHEGSFDPSRIRLADVDGSGPTDLLYLGPKGVTIWFNESGNGFGAPTELRTFPSVAAPNDVQVADLLGDGTSCLVWSSPLLSEGSRPLRYVRLMAEGKPWLLKTVTNGLGRETRLSYTPSTAFYLADRRAGTPWATRLPFPVHCLSKLEQVDHLTGWRFVNTFAYHHGYFDGEEREFRGFGLVEQWDTETVSDYEDPDQADPELVVALPPVRTKTWFHTGAWTQKATLGEAYAAEYSAADPAAIRVSEPLFPAVLTPAEQRDAHRALKGKMLRQEVYAEDQQGNLARLYTVAEQAYAVVRLQAAHGVRPASFRVDSPESLSAAYDLDLTSGSPDPRVIHTLSWDFDAYGMAGASATISYPRRGVGHDAEQLALTVVVTENVVINQDDPSADRWHLGVPARTRTWELTGTPVWNETTHPAASIAVAVSFESATSWTYEQTPSGSGAHKRLIGHQITRYWDDAVSGPISMGQLGARALVYQRYALAYTSGLVTALYGTRVGAAELDEGAYEDDPEGTGPTTDRWIPSGRTTPSASGFFQPTTHTDPFGNPTTLLWDGDFLAVTQVTDPVGMEVTAEIDYQLLQPWKITDPNGTESRATFDPLGRVLTTAVSNGTHGDQGTAVSGEFTYETDRWSTSRLPTRVHVRMLKAHGGTDWQESWVYSDGGGNVVKTKVQAAAGDAPARDPVTGELVFVGGVLQFAPANPRYVGTGRTVVNNKGLVVKQYEPFFSRTAEYEEEDDVVWGITPVFDYDPVGRNTKVTLPDGHVQRWEYDPWQVSAFDEDDNDPSSPHYDTPAHTHLDAQGRVYKLMETPDGTTNHVTRLTLDVQGNVLAVKDPRGNIQVPSYDIQVQRYDMVGRPGFSGAADEGYDGTSGKGETRAFSDVAGTPIRLWRSGNLTFRNGFDARRRPVSVYVDEGGGERLVTLTLYGDTLSDTPATDFAQGRAYHVCDTAGRVTTAYDFRGRTVSQVRQVFTDIIVEADWHGLDAQTDLTGIATSLTTNGTLDAETFPVTTAYDALDRVTEQTAPDTSRTVPGYDAGGRLTSVEVFVRGAATATPFVTQISYDARGQRLLIQYANHTSSTYTYDEARLWLTRIQTSRDASGAGGAATLQVLDYTRDAVGNITQITDDAQETVFFGNTQVSPDRTFAYDALYRLTKATGREKVQGQTTAFYVDYAGTTGGIPDPSIALRQYTQSYTYDAVGNILEMKHQQGLGGTTQWRRGYHYQSTNNQLVSTSRPGDDPDDPGTHSDTYACNDRGAMVFLPHLRPGVASNLTRDFRDQIRKADLDAAGNVAWYAYDAGGQRVRKLWDKGSVKEERIYVGGYEVWRQRNGGGTLQEERQTVHVTDDQRRIAMIETLTRTSGAPVATPVPRERYQLDDHLGTALLEVDHAGAVISYEEYHPYGTTSWWASASATGVSQKRYRYTGKEKDQETGLAYHGARYYAPWLGRWESPDPSGLVDGPNRYQYVRDNPIGGRDLTGTWTDDDLALRSEAPKSKGDVAIGFALGVASELLAGGAYAVGAPGYPVDVFMPHPSLHQASEHLRHIAEETSASGADWGILVVQLVGLLSFSKSASQAGGPRTAPEPVGMRGVAAAYTGPGKFTRTVLPRADPAGPRSSPPRTLTDMDPILDFLEAAGVEFDVDVLIRVVPDKVLPDAHATWADIKGAPDALVQWSALAPDDVVTIRMRESVFSNPEDLLSTMAHEMHEINAAKARIEGEGMTVREFVNETKQVANPKGNLETLHHQAVGAQDMILRAFQLKHPN
ncbi:MAG: toxin TcdB middle/N-terminal domain-containing protein [Myxococcota bacterium]